MPRLDRRKAIRISSTGFDPRREISQKHRLLLLKGKAIRSTESNVSSLNDRSRIKAPRRIPHEFLRNPVGRTKAPAVTTQEPDRYSSSKMLPFKSQNALLSRSAAIPASCSTAKESPLMTLEVLRKQNAGEQPISFFRGGGKLTRRKKKDLLIEREPGRRSEGAHRLSQAQTLGFLQALSKESLPFLELYCRFGVSKQMTKRLLKNKLIIEVWGPRAVGVRYKLSKKGEVHLKELEIAARYKPRITEKGMVHLKHVAQPQS